MRGRPATWLFPLAQGRRFWKLKAFWDRTVFRVSRFLFYRRESLRAKREEAGIFFSILTSVAGYTAGIVVILACVEAGERFLVGRGWTLGFLRPPTDKAYSSTDYVLQALIGIQGVFLAVYFTAVSVAASAIYAGVPHEVRTLLARDRVGSFFLQFIAACTAAALLMLGYRALGGTIGRGALLISVLLGCYSIFAILTVLKNSVILFDPARVGRVIFRDLAQDMRSASIQGFAWNHRSFQLFYSSHAAANLQTLGMVMDICAGKAGVGNKPLSNLVADTVGCWSAYAYFRGRIPFESDWYRSVYRHKQWLMAREMEIGMALNTQTTLRPETRKDRNWLESGILPVLERGLLTLLERADVVSAHEGLVAISHLVRQLAGQLDTTNLAALQAIAKRLADRWAQLAAKTGPPATARDEREEIGLADSLGMIPVSAVLGTGDWASSFTFAALDTLVRETDWSDAKAVYRWGFPYGALGELEHLQKKLAFEIAVEGRRVSPDWYVREIVLLAVLRALKPCLDSVEHAVDRTLIDDANQFFDAKRYRSCCALVLRGLEFLAKYAHSLSAVKRVVDGAAERSKIKDLPWPSFNFDELARKLKASRREYLKLLAKLIPALSAIPSDETLEDYFGASYVHVLEESYLALIEDDVEAFQEFFPAAFDGAMLAFDKLREPGQGWSRDAGMMLQADVLMDILELGSYAKFLAEYRRDNRAWDVCTGVWDVFLSEHANPPHVIKLVLASARLREAHFAMSARALCRMHWQQTLGGYLAKQSSLMEGYYLPGRRRPPRHPHESRLVRSICTTFGMGVQWPGSDLFIIAYFEVHRKPEKPLDFRDNHGIRKLLDTSAQAEARTDEDEE